MGFSINPNQHYLKLIFIVSSVQTLDHIEAVERCIELYDSRKDYYIKYFKNSTDKPIVAHTGDYDHDTAIWIIKKKLQNKANNL